MVNHYEKFFAVVLLITCIANQVLVFFFLKEAFLTAMGEKLTRFMSHALQLKAISNAIKAKTIDSV